MTSLNQEKPGASLRSPIKLLEDGKKKEKLKQLEQKDEKHTGDMILQNLLNSLKEKEGTQMKKFHEELKNLKEKIVKKSVTQEYLRMIRKKIWSDKKTSLRQDFQTTKLLVILDQVLTLRGKDLKPFWDIHCKELSKKLWLPIKTDCVASELNFSNSTSKNFLGQKSWFSTKKHIPHMMNSSKISSPSQQSFPQNSTDLGREKQKETKKKESKKKVKKALKTLKIRLVLTPDEKKLLKIYFGLFRWHYNCAKNIFESQESKQGLYKKDGSVRWQSVRDLIRTYKVFDSENKYKYEYVKQDEKYNKVPIPEWFKTKNLQHHARIPRGAVHNFVANFNSAYSNYKNGNIKNFNMNYRTKKDKSQILYFEDAQIPQFIKKFTGIYKIGRKRIKFSKILKMIPTKNLTIQYDERINRYTLLYPVDIDWTFNVSETQTNGKSLFISLDTGVRTFQTGYASDHVLEIGNGDCKKITNMLKQADRIKSLMDIYGWKKKWKNRFMRIYYKIRCMVNELHWKLASFLTKSYSNILLPEFSISGMVRNNKLPKCVKRLLYTFSFYKFKEKMIFKALQNNSNLYIVGEEYTSKTCTNCGLINNNLGSSKIFNCPSCKISIDRDINGARNILLKNYDKIKQGFRTKAS